jgi:aspartate aminotransferase-like enzyme
VDEQRGRGRDIRVLAPEGFRSPAVTCISAPSGRTGPDVVKAMKARGFVITAGYGDLKDAMFRIGHMGEHTVEELDVLLGALDEVLA